MLVVEGMISENQNKCHLYKTIIFSSTIVKTGALVLDNLGRWQLPIMLGISDFKFSSATSSLTCSIACMHGDYLSGISTLFTCSYLYGVTKLMQFPLAI